MRFAVVLRQTTTLHLWDREDTHMRNASRGSMANTKGVSTLKKVMALLRPAVF